MTRIAALNDFTLGSSDEEDAGPTREALEAEATKNYNQAIRYLALRKFSEAYEQFQLVLQNSLIEKAYWPDGIEPGGILPQDLALKYACLKNLGNLAYKRGDYDQSVEYYMEAVKIDRTEITLWHRLGASAIKLRDFELALVAFQEGYHVNPKHWPCLDQLLSVLYILRNYMDCLALAALALDRDPGYIKALAFKDKIFEIQPSLKTDIKYFIPNSSVLFKKVDYDKAQGDKFISTCEDLRPPNKMPQPPVPIPSQHMRKPLGELTWDNLAQSLLATYDALIEEDGMAFAGQIDIYDILNRRKTTVLDADMEDLGVAPLDGWNRDGVQDFGKERIMRRDRNSVDSIQGNPIRLSGRRRTIELGESQDSFRVSEKRRSIDSDTSRPEDTKSEDSRMAMPQAGNVKEDLDNNSTAKEEIKGNPDAVTVRGIQAEDLQKIDAEENSPDRREIVEDAYKRNSSTENVETGKEFCALNGNQEDGRVVMNGDPNMRTPGGESDNDFKGFINNSPYKERHRKLVQGKSVLEIREDGEFDDLDNSDAQEMDSPMKDELYNSEVRGSDLGSEYELDSSRVEEGNVSFQEDIEKDQSFQLEEEDKSGQPHVSSCEEEAENQDGNQSQNVEEGDDIRCEVVDGGDGEMEVNVQGDFEEHLDNMENNQGEAPLQDVQRREGFEGENEANVARDIEEHLRNMERAASKADEGVNEELSKGGITDEGVDPSAGENEIRYEEHEGEMEGNEMVVGEEEEEQELGENEGIIDENEGYHEVDEGIEDDGMMNTEVTETEAAVNALKGIMALQPTEILGLPEPEFDYENEFVEYFDGGVYEEEEDEMMNPVDQGEEDENPQEMVEDSQDIEGCQENPEQQEYTGQEDLHQGEDSSQGEGETQDEEVEEEEETQQEEGTSDKTLKPEVPSNEGGEHDKPKETANEEEKQHEEKRENDVSRNKNLDASIKRNQIPASKEMLDKDNSVDKTVTDDSTTTDTACKPVTATPGRKPKRTKRGLERELEQLDYWGRRQERDAKRRRRTISSKLLGGIEEAEYLTWGDLLRSFVPGPLLTVSEVDKKKSELSEGQSQLTGSVDASASVNGSQDVKINGSQDISISGSQDAKVSGSQDAIVSGSQDAKVSGSQDAKVNGFQDTKVNSSQDTKINGSQDAKVNGSQDAKISGSQDIKIVENEKAELKEQQQGMETTETQLAVSEQLVTDSSNVKTTENVVEEKMEIPDEEVVSDSDTLKSQREQTMLSSSASEELQVQAFLIQYEYNGGILHLLQQFLKILMKRHKFVWPLAAAKMFTQVYPRVRCHVTRTSPFNLKESWQKLKEESLLSLVHWELCCSLYQVSKGHSTGSSVHNPFSDNPSYLEEDIFYLILMLGRGDVWAEETPQFHTRLRWLQSQIRLIRGQPEEAVSYLELLLSDLERLAGDGTGEYVCNRVRVESDNVVVANAEVKRQLNVLQRSHMLEQVVDNYTDCRYRVVADLLTSIFHEPLPKSRPGVTLPSRQTQLAILVDSLYRLSEYKLVIYWGSFSLTEALRRYNRAEAEEEKNRWAKTLLKITDTMNNMLVKDINILKEVDQERLVETVSSLIDMLVVQLEKPQSAIVLPFETLIPWILLHRILSYRESCQESIESKKITIPIQESDVQATTKSEALVNGAKESEINGNDSKGGSVGLTAEPSSVNPVPNEAESQGKEAEMVAPAKGPVTPHPSTLFLITAHDELGKHSWCCYDDGSFLLYCLDALLVELQRLLDDQHRQLLHHTLEQVTFCLYSHPSKRTKHKHLRDHGVPQIAFSWEVAVKLYEYYRPKVLPDFQTSLIASITGDAAVLFKRIIALLPDEAKPADQTKGVEAYINGQVSVCNYTPFKPPTDIINDCYYLLGDYYFKSKEWMDAIEYYKLDLSINHERLESWAPLGLSMKAMLETQLTTCEIIKDEEGFFSLAKAAVQCLRQALRLDQYHTNLWVEYGGLVYMVHSHASRLLKQELNPDISLETFDMLENFKNEMLDLAENCFTRALSLQEETYEDEGLPDERWLHCYMLGKVSEKKNKPPHIIIQYYLKASHYLHNIGAKYPVRINYNSPQEYSVEALEMYYRIHAYMLKYLHQKEGRDVDPDVLITFNKCLSKMDGGHFRNCREKKPTDSNAISDLFLIEVPPSKKRTLEDGGEEPPAKRLQGQGSQGEESKDVGEVRRPSTGRDRKESDDDIQVVEEKVIEKKDHYAIVSRCLAALRLCLSRFQEHYKTMYRLAHYYHTSKFHKDNTRAQNYLLGCHTWQSVGYMPVNGLFNERKIWIQQPKNSNFFHGVWRIPNDEIDRPGSFPAHMYRCVSIILDILPQVKDFFMILQIALALKNSPDKDKKYLRDNERELLSEHATQVGLQVMKDKFKLMFKTQSPVNTNRHLKFLLDVYRSYKQVSKHLPGSEPHFAKMLTDAYACYKEIKVENRSNVLREADTFCHRHQHLQPRAPVPSQPSDVRDSLNMSESPTPAPAPTIARRGRPPLTGRGRGRGRGSMYNTGRTVGDMLAVQQAYKIYENLISTQTLLNKKQISPEQVYSYQKQLEGYQSQLMKYLQIPCVSQYFQASLQGLGTASTKLPPPKIGSEAAGVSVSRTQPPRPNVDPTTTTTTTTTISSSDKVSPVKPSPAPMVSNPGVSSSIPRPPPKADQQRIPLDTLSVRSQAHGISITSIPGTKISPSGTQGQQLKPNMSVTVSPVKPAACPPALQGRDISVVSVSQTSTTKTNTFSVSKKNPGKISLPASTTVKPVNASVSTPNLPSSTTVKPLSTPVVSTMFKPASSSPTVGGSTTIKAVSSSTGGSTAFKAVSTAPSGSTTISKVTIASGSNTNTTTFKPSVTGGTTGFKTTTSSSNSSVPKLPAGTTLTRPRDPSPAKGPGPRPQLQANVRPVKSNLSDGVSVKKVIPQVLSSNTSTSKPGGSVSIERSPGFITKTTFPKDMTITPTPRVKAQPRPVTTSRPVSSPFFRAFEASLGLSSAKTPEKSVTVGSSGGSSSGTGRSVSQGQTTSISNPQGRVAQLSTKDLLQMAYRSDTLGQTSVGRVQQPITHKQSSGSLSFSGQYSKLPQQPRAPSQQASSSSSSSQSGSTLTRIQSSLNKVATEKAQQKSQPTGNPSQSNPSNKPAAPKKPGGSTDDIITLD